jgi:hypothetical protein
LTSATKGLSCGRAALTLQRFNAVFVLLALNPFQIILSNLLLVAPPVGWRSPTTYSLCPDDTVNTTVSLNRETCASPLSRHHNNNTDISHCDFRAIMNQDSNIIVYKIILLVALLWPYIISASIISYKQVPLAILDGHGLASNSDVIPGESPFVYCDSNTREDLLQIEYVAVTPNPPRM